MTSALAGIALTNAVLLLGLFVLDWPPGTIAFLFWFEAAVIGAVTFIKVAASLPGNVPGTGERVTYRRLPRPGGNASATSALPRVGPPLLALPLFVFFYGLVLLAYGGALLVALKDWNYAARVGSAVSSDGVRLAMALIAGEHLWAFWRDYVRGPAWQRKDPTFQFWSPFGLAIVTWFAFFFGFLTLGWLNSPLVVLTLLILIKAIAQSFSTLFDAQAGEWHRVDETT